MQKWIPYKLSACPKLAVTSYLIFNVKKILFESFFSFNIFFFNFILFYAHTRTGSDNTQQNKEGDGENSHLFFR